MGTSEMLEELKLKAKKNPALRQKLLASRESETPLADFCAICREEGYPIWEMDVLEAGESYYAAMRRSTNGGGENSPLLRGEDDYYELFFAGLV